MASGSEALGFACSHEVLVAADGAAAAVAEEGAAVVAHHLVAGLGMATGTRNPINFCSIRVRA